MLAISTCPLPPWSRLSGRSHDPACIPITDALMTLFITARIMMVIIVLRQLAIV